MLDAVSDARATFVKKKLKGGVATNRGTFLPYESAKITRVKLAKKEKIQVIKIRFGVRREVIAFFPKRIIDDLDAIQSFVARLTKKYKPDYIRWVTYNSNSSHIYSPNKFSLYHPDAVKNNLNDNKNERNILKHFIGVALGFDPNIT